MTVILCAYGSPAIHVEVSSFEEASEKVTAWQDAEGLGESDLGARHGVVCAGDNALGRIAYNGTVVRY